MLVHSAGSGVNSVQVVLSGFSVRLYFYRLRYCATCTCTVETCTVGTCTVYSGDVCDILIVLVGIT